MGIQLAYAAELPDEDMPALLEAVLLTPGTKFQILIVEIIWKKEMKVIIYLGGLINRGPLWF